MLSLSHYDLDLTWSMITGMGEYRYVIEVQEGIELYDALVASAYNA